MAQERPNILFIMTDEQRYDSLGCYGNPVLRTPHIDSLAREGVRFERCYVQNPMCMPARMAIMTGRYCSEHYDSDHRPPPGVTVDAEYAAPEPARAT
jgi:arylsulfatase A-like enzyme